MTSTDDSKYLTFQVPYPNVLGIHALIVVLLIVISVFVYAPALEGEFLYSWDDQRFVTDNYRITDMSMDGLKVIFTEPFFGVYTPITTLSLAIDYQIWGLNPYGYKLTNLIIHTANAVLVYILLFILMKPVGSPLLIAIGAGIAAFLFSLHPVQVEIVVWVSQRRAVLSLFFTLLAFLAHIRSSHEGGSSIWLVLGWFLFLLAVLSKAVSVGAPFCFIVYDFFWAKKSIRQVLLRNTIPILTGFGGALGGVITQSDIGAVQDLFGGTLITHLQVIFVAIWDYVPNLVLPTNMNALYLYPADEIYIRIGETVLGLAVFFGSLLWALYDVWRWRKTRQVPLVLMAVTWVWMFYAPVSNIVPMPMLRADRYMYVPVIMIFALVGLGLVRLGGIIWKAQKGWLIPYVVALLVIPQVMLLYTIQHRDVWQRSETLWRDHLKDYPDSTSGLLNLGVYYFKVGEYELAEPYFKQILEKSPQHSKANEFMGNLSFNRGDYETASVYYQTATETHDAHYSYYGLGRSLQKLDNARGAFEAYQQLLTLNPRFTEAYSYYGEVALRVGERDIALSALDKAVENNPSDAPSHSFLCLIYGDREEFESAVYHCEQSLILDAENGRYAGRYAHVLILLNEPTAALPIAQRATQLAPNESLGFRTLGDAYRLLGDADSARLAYQQALAIFPDNALASEGLTKLES